MKLYLGDKEIKPGEEITSFSGGKYIFKMIVTGRFTPKLYVTALAGGFGREFYSTVFPAYEVRKD
jgi:hypothetical protein